MKTFIFCAILILSARNALAECTSTSAYSLPLTATIDISDIVSVPPAEYITYARKVYTQANFAALFGVSMLNVSKALVACDGGETLIIENPDLNVNGSYFDTNVDNMFMAVLQGGSILLPSAGSSEIVANTSTLYSLYSALGSISGIGKDTGIGFYGPLNTSISGQIDGSLGFRIRTSDGLVIAQLYYNSFNVEVGSCNVNTFDNEVSFNELAVQKLRDPGSTSDEIKFKINIICGMASLVPAITFTGGTDSEYTNVFTNQEGDGYARGVGVQILKDDSIITPGEAFSLGAASTTAAIDYEFSSHIFSLSNQTTEGAIDIPVTFTLTYE